MTTVHTIMDAVQLNNETMSLWGHFVPVEMPLFLVVSSNILGVIARNFMHIVREHWVQDTFKMLLLGTIVQTARSFWSTIFAKVVQSLYVEARFQQGDFAWDWLDDYLDSQRVWGRAPKYHVVTRPTDISAADVEIKQVDTHPQPIYESAPDQPEFWNWNGHWIKVMKERGKESVPSEELSEMFYKTQTQSGGYISLSVYSWKRHVIDLVVNEAREHYLKSSRPRIINSKVPSSKCYSVVTATFQQPDLCFDWMLSFLVFLGAFDGVTSISVAAKMSTSMEWGLDMHQGSAHRVAYTPSADNPQMVKWKDMWLQVTRDSGSHHWRTGRDEGKLTVIIHRGTRFALGELVEAARMHWKETARNYVMIHLADSHGSWDRVIKKSRRSLDTVILPLGVKEMLFADSQHFLRSEQWYKDAGIPWRRGYLLYGVPGTGKSSTIHALASELMLPIYSISLATRGLDDTTLQYLISEAPAESIMCLEDIDCAFPRRRVQSDEDEESDADNEEQTDDESQEDNEDARQNYHLLPASMVTLSGLLNALDGMASEEGRMIFATTNHIKNLDPALIRPGRFDIKVQYTHATREQATRMFLRFFRPDYYPASALTSTSVDFATYAPREKVYMDAERLSELAADFASEILEDAFSAAALQAHLLVWKHDPLSAVAGVPELVTRHEEEIRAREEARQKSKAMRMKARAAKAENVKNVANGQL